MLACGYACYVSPADCRYAALPGFAFPFFLVADVAFVAVWAAVKPRRLWLPLAAIVLAWGPVRLTCPVSISGKKPQRSIRVMSFNVEGFEHDRLPADEPSPILDYLLTSGADIICLQEYTPVPGDIGESQMRRLGEAYPYFAMLDTHGFAHAHGDIVAVYSRFPITEWRNIEIHTRGNTVGAFHLDIAGQKVWLINAHLETVGLSMIERRTFEQMMRGKTSRSGAKRESRTLAGKLMHSAAMRAPQADIVAAFVDSCGTEPVIVCGDFNDPPLSYVHHTIARRLTDCYEAAGLGPGFSYHHHLMHVRIDNILCSRHFRPYRCRVDRSMAVSDHYPIRCRLAVR